MTRNEIIEQVNDLLEEEFEIEKSEFAPEASMKEAAKDEDFQRPLRLH